MNLKSILIGFVLFALVACDSTTTYTIKLGKDITPVLVNTTHDISSSQVIVNDIYNSIPDEINIEIEVEDDHDNDIEFISLRLNGNGDNWGGAVAYENNGHEIYSGHWKSDVSFGYCPVQGGVPIVTLTPYYNKARLIKR